MSRNHYAIVGQHDHFHLRFAKHIILGCRKGKRNCIYPEPPRPSRAGHRSKSIPDDEALPEEEDDDEDDKVSPTVLGKNDVKFCSLRALLVPFQTVV